MSNARAASAGPPSPGHRRIPAGTPAEVPSITSAPEPLADDQARRTRRYLVQMSMRLVFFLAAIFLAEGWVRWVLVAGAVVLPYSAVLFANAGRDRVTYDSSPVTAVEPAALPAAPASDALRDNHRVVDHQDDPEGGAAGSGDDGRAGQDERDAGQDEKEER